MKSDVVVFFEHELFVDREKAKQEFLNCLSSKIAPLFLEFHGVAGQGKTEFLKWIYANPQHEHYAAMYLDLERAEYYHYDLYPMLETMSAQLAQQIDPLLFQNVRAMLPLYIQELRVFYGMSINAPNPAKPAALQAEEQTLIRSFLDEMQSILTWRKVVLCLDSTEKAYTKIFQAFERQILSDLAHHHNFLLVAAGQERITWQTTNIRNRIRPLTLVNFDPKWIQQQIEQISHLKHIQITDHEFILKKLNQLTGGHPYSNYRFLNFWSNGFTIPLDKSRVEHQIAAGIHHVIQHVLEGRILARTTLDEAYPQAKTILWFLAPLRHIELSMFRYVLTKHLPDFFEGKPFTFFERLMGIFQRTSIFTRWHLGSGFETNPAVRNLLLGDMRVNNPAFFLQMTEDLQQQYDYKVQKTHDATQIKHLIEHLYHYAVCLKTTQPNYDNIDEMKTELTRYIHTYFTQEYVDDEMVLREQLNRLYNGLDDDEELAELIDVSVLLTMIQERMQEAEE